MRHEPLPLRLNTDAIGLPPFPPALWPVYDKSNTNHGSELVQRTKVHIPVASHESAQRPGCQSRLLRNHVPRHPAALDCISYLVAKGHYAYHFNTIGAHCQSFLFED